MATPSLPSAGEVVATIDVGANPAALASGAGALWVANRNLHEIMRIDLANGSAKHVGVGEI
jgi:hypothetical protein